MARWYGSLQNRLTEWTESDAPEVGMGATEMWWSDREPFEIIEVKDARHCTARAMGYKAVGEPMSNDWEIFPDEGGRTVNLFRKKNGQWVERYESRRYGNVFRIGYADKYYDYSF